MSVADNSGIPVSRDMPLFVLAGPTALSAIPKKNYFGGNALTFGRFSAALPAWTGTRLKSASSRGLNHAKTGLQWAQSGTIIGIA